MKVVFKLNPAQIAKAKEIAAMASIREEGEKGKDGGNMVGWIYDGGYGVSPQNLNLEGNLLTYKGSRTAFLSGTGLCYHKVMQIFGGGVGAATRAIVSFESSDAKMPWWADTELWVVQPERTIDEILEVAEKHPEKQCGATAKHRLLSIIGGVENLRLLKENPARANAQWTSSELSLIRKVARIVLG